MEAIQTLVWETYDWFLGSSAIWVKFLAQRIDEFTRSILTIVADCIMGWE